MTCEHNDMSLPLIDLRGKITAETDVVLDVVSKTSGRDRAEIVREVLAQWAEGKRHEAILLGRALEAQGLGGLERRAPRSLREA